MKITQETIDKAKYYLEKYPEMQQMDIARICGCSEATISSIKHGRYDTGVLIDERPRRSHHKKREEPTEQQDKECDIDIIKKRLDDISDGLFVANAFLASIALSTIDERYGDVDADALMCACTAAKGMVRVEAIND